jgi:hypothetical protein
MMMVKTKEKAQAKSPVSIISSEIKIKVEDPSLDNLLLSPEVIEFLNHYEFLKPILAEAPDKIRKFFPDAEIDYEVTTDPEVENWVTLEIILFTHLSAEDAFERMKKLKTDWWLQTYVNSDRKLRLDIALL